MNRVSEIMLSEHTELYKKPDLPMQNDKKH